MLAARILNLGIMLATLFLTTKAVRRWGSSVCGGAQNVIALERSTIIKAIFSSVKAICSTMGSLVFLLTTGWGCGALLSVLFSCTTASELERLLSAPAIISIDSVGLQPVSESKIPIRSKLTFLRSTIYGESLVYAFAKEEPGKLFVFDVIQGKFLREIVLDPEILDQDKMTTFYVLNPDSIFFMGSNGLSVRLAEGNGAVRSTWTAEVLGFGPVNNFLFPYFLPQYQAYFQSRSLLHLTVVPAFFPTKKGYEDQPLQVVVDLSKDRTKLAYGPAEGVMRFKESLVYPTDISFPYALVRGDTTFVSFPMDHFIYVYNNKSGKLLSKHGAASRHVSEFPAPVPADESKDYQRMWNFRIQTPFYEPLFYHARAKLYSRTVQHPQALKDEEGLLNTGRHRTASVIIMDQHLRIVGETIFEDGGLPVHGSVPLPDGLLVKSHQTVSTIANIPRLKYAFTAKDN